MQNFIVLYVFPHQSANRAPKSQLLQAATRDDAKERVKAAFTEASVVFVYEGSNHYHAYQAYYGQPGG